jgi:hypothetical protein
LQRPGVEAIHGRAVGARNEVAVSVDRDLNPLDMGESTKLIDVAPLQRDLHTESETRPQRQQDPGMPVPQASSANILCG